MPAVTTIRPGQPGTAYASAEPSGTTTTWLEPGRQRACRAAETRALTRRQVAPPAAHDGHREQGGPPDRGGEGGGFVTPDDLH